MYRRSIDDPEGFWGEQGKRIDWFTPYTKVKDVSFDAKDLHIRWFYDGTLNASYNCLDRHLATRGDQVAIIWEGDDPAKDRKITYRELHAEVCRSEEHTSELQSLMRISYAVFCLKKKNYKEKYTNTSQNN